jgi:hypothetical protein
MFVKLKIISDRRSFFSSCSQGADLATASGLWTRPLFFPSKKGKRVWVWEAQRISLSSTEKEKENGRQLEQLKEPATSSISWNYRDVQKGRRVAAGGFFFLPRILLRRRQGNPGLMPCRPDPASPGQGVASVVDGATDGGWRRSAVPTAGGSAGGGSWRRLRHVAGDTRGKVRPVFGMLSSWRGLPTQLCGCSSSRRVDALLARLLRDGRQWQRWRQVGVRHLSRRMCWGYLGRKPDDADACGRCFPVEGVVSQQHLPWVKPRSIPRRATAAHSTSYSSWRRRCEIWLGRDVSCGGCHPLLGARSTPSSMAGLDAWQSPQAGHEIKAGSRSCSLPHAWARQRWTAMASYLGPSVSNLSWSSVSCHGKSKLLAALQPCSATMTHSSVYSVVFAWVG